MKVVGAAWVRAQPIINRIIACINEFVSVALTLPAIRRSCRSFQVARQSAREIERERAG